MNLDDHSKQSVADTNLLWRLDSGATLNLLDEAIERLEAIQDILDRSRDCDKYADDEPITCGWKRDLQDIKHVLDLTGNQQ